MIPYLFAWAILSAPPAAPLKATPTAAETIRYLQSKGSEAVGGTYRSAASFDRWVTSVSIVGSVDSGVDYYLTTANGPSGADKESYEETRQSFSFDPRNIVSVTEVGKKKTAPTGAVNVKFSSLSVRHSQTSYIYRYLYRATTGTGWGLEPRNNPNTNTRIDEFSFFFFREDAGSGDRVKKAFLHLRDLGKAAHVDPFAD